MNPQDPNGAIQPEQPVAPMQPIEQTPLTQQFNAPVVSQPDYTPTQAYQPPAAVYSEPTSAVSDDDGFGEYVSNPFLNSIRGLILILKHNPVPIILSSFVGLLLYFGVAILGGVLAAVLSKAGAGGVIAVVFISLIAFIAVVVTALGSFFVIAGHSAKGEKVTLREAYKQSFKHILGAIVQTILLGIILTIGFILLVIPGLFLLGRFSLSYLLMYEENLSAIAAMKRSWAITKGHTIEMLGAVFAGSLLSGGGLLIGATAVSPLVGRYNDLQKLEASGAPKPKIHYLNWLIPVVVVLFFGAYFGFIFAVTYSGIQSRAKVNQSDTQALQQFQDQNNVNNSQSFDSGSSSSTDTTNSSFNN